MSYSPFIGNRLSTDNSTTTLLLASQTFTGVWEECVDYTTIAVAILTNNVTDGTLYFDLSTDGGTTFVSVPRAVGDTTFNFPHVIAIVESHFRIRYVNGTTNQLGFFNLQTKLSNGADLPISHLMTDTLTDEAEGVVNKSVITAQTLSGDFVNIKGSERGELFTVASESELNRRLVYQEAAINGNSYALLIDLSDTVNFPHTETGYIEMSTLKLFVDRSSTNSVGAVSIGVVTAITAVSATIEYGFKAGFSKSDQRRILTSINWSPSRLKFSTSGGAWTGGITNEFETTVSVNSITTLKCTTGVATIPAVGDIIVRFEESGSGDYDFGLETDYHSEA